MAQFYITEEFYVKNSNNNKGETNKKIYDSFDEAVLDFNKRIFKLEETDSDQEVWDIRLYGKLLYLEDLLLYYTTEEETLAVYKENWGHFVKN